MRGGGRLRGRHGWRRLLDIHGEFDYRLRVLLDGNRLIVHIDRFALVNDIHAVIEVDGIRCDYVNEGSRGAKRGGRPPPPGVNRIMAHPATAPTAGTPPAIIKHAVIEVPSIVPDFLGAISTVIPQILPVLLPILAILIAPVLAVFTGAFEVVPALVAGLLKIVARLLAVVGALVPSVMSVVHALLPLVAAILRPVIPVGPLLRPRWALARAGAFAESRALCGKLRGATGNCAA